MRPDLLNTIIVIACIILVILLVLFYRRSRQGEALYAGSGHYETPSIDWFRTDSS